jgi:heme-degrading monooxygenase HmoA
LEELAEIPGVKNFLIRRQVSPKNFHTFGLSIHFDSDEDFRAYSNHPLHDAFVQKRWITEVEDFQESDFEAM